MKEGVAKRRRATKMEAAQGNFQKERIRKRVT